MLSTFPNHVPDEVLRDAASPGSSVTTDCPENSSARHKCRSQPPVNRILHPDRHRDCSDMIAFTYEIDDRPMSLPNLNIFLPQGCQLRSSKTTADQGRYHGDISDIT
jgi:hypothetical protein